MDLSIEMMAVQLAMALAQVTPDAADDALTAAGDLLDDRGETKASALLDGMRAGMGQAREAVAGRRVVAIWYDDNGARATFSWNPDDDRGAAEWRAAVEQAVASALRPNGEGA